MRVYERLPAANYARTYRTRHNQLEQEVHGAYANDDEERPVQFNPLVIAFFVMSGCAFWGEIAVLIFKHFHLG